MDEHAQHWLRLAEVERERARHLVQLGSPTGYTGAYELRAKLYEQTARALELERDTGIPHCSCCLKPRRNHGKV
jgi:hypothetical protein